jgi:outer membrane biosynthesis protein TonB
MFSAGTGMTSSVDRTLIFALSFSLAVHAAGTGLVTLMQTDSRKASHTAPVDLFQVTLQQLESLPAVEPEPVKKSEPVTMPKPVVVSKSVQKAIPLPVPKPVRKPVPRPSPAKKPEQKKVSESIERQKREGEGKVSSKAGGGIPENRLL